MAMDQPLCIEFFQYPPGPIVIAEWHMDKVKIQIIQLQPVQGFVKRRQSLSYPIC